LGQIDKAAIVWTIAIVAVGAGFAGFGLQNQGTIVNNSYNDITDDELEFQKSLEDYQGDTTKSTDIKTDLEKVQKMVSSAVNLYDKVGKDSFESFNSGSDYHDGGLYIFVFRSSDSIMVAHGASQSIIGKPVDVILDINGESIGKMVHEKATIEGAWVEYLWTDPVDNKIHPKETWVVIHDGYIFGTGLYLP
jgi:signal transduction histidine kinase